MKCYTKQTVPLISPAASSFWKKRKSLLFSVIICLFSSVAIAQQTGSITVSGTVKDSSGNGLAQSTITEKGTTNAATTNEQGRFTLQVANAKSTLVVTTVGYVSQSMKVGTKTDFTVLLTRVKNDLDEVIVIGYGTKNKQALTGAISTVNAKDLDRVHGGSTVSTGLAGKLPGVTFRMSDGRPGSTANIQIRNMGTPLFVIDGIQSDINQFDNLSPNDVESITILKDASAAIYGVRAANGVVVVTTKRGKLNDKSKVNLDVYTGAQNWTRFPQVVKSSYDYMRYRAEAEVNTSGSTGITQAELDKYKIGADPAYRSFDWTDFVIKKNAPQTSLNANLTGGSDKVRYYLSGTNLAQNSVLGREYKYNRTNIQSNVTAQISKSLKVGVQINGRSEIVENPGVPGGDDYFLAKFAIIRNTPLDRPYANDNPQYLQDNGDHTQANWAFLNYKIAGKYKSARRAITTNVDAEWQIPAVKGLVLKGVYSYYLEDYLLNNHEYTYDAYTYRPVTKIYERTNGSSNPWRERDQRKQENVNTQVQLNYNNKFGDHTIGATVVAERIKRHYLRNWLHASPTTNALPLIYFPTADTYNDEDAYQARVGYIGRITYSFANRYFLEASARRDASYLFAPDKRVGYFPGISAGWRVTEEPLIKRLLGNQTFVNDLKFRGSYGVLGDDRNPNDPNSPIVGEYAYLQGYNYNQGLSIFNNNAVVGSRDRGVPVTNISWLKSKVTDIGLDYVLLKNKITGSVDYFYRKRTGLLAPKSDVVIPSELGYNLPDENLNSDASFGGEFSINYAGKAGDLNYTIGGNFSYARTKTLDFYKPRFFNSWDQYRSSGVNRYAHMDWGYETIGQFKSQEEINNYKVNIDGKGNRTLIPGDLIYKDQNNDGKIDGYDERPIGFGYGTQPNVNFGFSLGLNYKNFDFHADFSGGAGYTWFQNWETRWAFQNNGNLNSIFEDRWHRTDLFDVNSAWVPGKYPANRINPGHGHSDYGGPDGNQWNSTFWLHSVKYLRARTMELGYTIPNKLINKIKIQGARFYVNTYNLFSIDNLKSYGIDPEVTDDNGLQFPQNKFVNIGFHISL